MGLEIYHPKELQHKEDDGDDNQNMDPAAGFRESWAYVRT